MRWFVERLPGMQHRMLTWKAALALLALLHLAPLYFISGLSFNNSPEAYYHPSTPAVVLRDELRRDFPTDEVLTALFRSEDLFSPAFLERIRKLSGILERDPLVDRVISITTQEKISNTKDGFSVGKLIEPELLRNGKPEQIRKAVMEDRFAPGVIVARDGKYLAVVVRPKPLSESWQRVKLSISVYQAINEAGLRPNFVAEAGPITMDVAQLNSILDDTKKFMPITVALGLALMWWVIGRIKPVVLSSVAMTAVLLPTIAGIAISGQPYTMATSILPSLLSAYTMATLLHLYAAVQRGHRAGFKRRQAVDRALEETLKPGLFNVLTTGAGLLSLVLVPIPPVQVFGVAGAFGTVMVFVVVFVLIPPLLLQWETRRWPARGSGLQSLGNVAKRMAFFSMRRPKLMLWGALASVVVTLPLIARVEVESDVLAFFSKDHPLTVHTRLIENKLAGVTSLEILLRGDGSESLQRVDTMKAMRSLQDWLEALPEVDRTISMTDLVEEMNWAMNGQKAGTRALPSSDKLLKQYLLVYDGREIYELVNRDFDKARILLSLNVHGTTEIAASIEKIRTRLKEQAIPGVVSNDIGGYGRLFADQVNLLVSGQINSFAGAFLQIFVFMAFLWRSIKGAAICMVPNIAPLFFIFVVMGAADLKLDLATVMIASIVLGITVDDTIHLYHGYLHRRKNGASTVMAIGRQFQASGRAVLAISVLLIGQFALLATSDFVPTANFGLMTSVGLLAGQAFELLLLPALLLVVDRRSSAAKVFSRKALAPASTDVGEVTSALEREALQAQLPRQKYRVLVCRGKACKDAGGEALWQHWCQQAQQRKLTASHPGVLVTGSECLGACSLAPVAQVQPDGVYYCGLDRQGIERVIDVHLVGGDVLAEAALRPSAGPLVSVLPDPSVSPSRAGA